MADRQTEEAAAIALLRLKRALQAVALIIRVRFEQFVTAAQADEVIRSIELSLEGSNSSEALSTVVNQLAPMRLGVAEAFTKAGELAANEIADDPKAILRAATVEPSVELVGTGAAAEAAGGGAAGGGGAAATSASGGPLARIGIVFDPVNQRAADLMRKEADLLIKQLSREQIEVTREAIAHAFTIGQSPRATAQAIKDSIGLTSHQLQIVRNYEDALRSQSARALNYQLRNRAKDGAVERAAGGGRQLTGDQIDRMVAQYRANFIKHRAETIARTESTRITSMAREESYRQIADKLGIGHNRIIRVWNATEDDRTRDWHASMHGDEAAIGQPFIDGLGNKLMYPGDPSAPAETVINCRCALTMRIADD